MGRPAPQLPASCGSVGRGGSDGGGEHCGAVGEVKCDGRGQGVLAVRQEPGW